MVKLLKFMFWLAAALAGVAWTIVSAIARGGAEADRGRPEPGLDQYRDWDGTIRHYTYDLDGKPTPGEGIF